MLKKALCLVIFTAATLTAAAQATAPDPAQDPASAKSAAKAAKQAKTPNFFDPKLLDLSRFVAQPPAQDSEQTKNELAELHRIEQTRTADEVAKAQYDDTHENIFSFKTVLGEKFTPENLPITKVFGEDLRSDEPLATEPLKKIFHRPRPYQFDSTLHAVCTTKTIPDSYPSGHSFSGYFFALVLAEMVPEKKAELFARATEYAHNRMVCGVHYRSDTEASHLAASITFGYMMANPRFQKELAAARAETRKALGLE